uniref:Putative multidrug export protein MepA n=1 Tax=uncultured bacterium Contig1771_n_1784_cl TaxID=1393511 RepID=W0FN54_9BACT|nr:putative multidrug export protein MepA [uncultured bacterium Contig1771_n_1784_cl]
MSTENPYFTQKQGGTLMQHNQTSSSATANEEMLRSGSFWTLARKLCIPAILIMLVMVLYHMADVFFIGQTGDANKVAAVTLASPMFSILSGLGVLLGNGGCTAISLSLGKGEYDKNQKNKRLCCVGRHCDRRRFCRRGAAAHGAHLQSAGGKR